MPDACDKIGRGDERFAAARALVAADGCEEAERLLTACLARNERFFARCQPETRALGVCLRARGAQKP